MPKPNPSKLPNAGPYVNNAAYYRYMAKLSDEDLGGAARTSGTSEAENKRKVKEAAAKLRKWYEDQAREVTPSDQSASYKTKNSPREVAKKLYTKGKQK